MTPKKALEKIEEFRNRTLLCRYDMNGDKYPDSKVHIKLCNDVDQFICRIFGEDSEYRQLLHTTIQFESRKWIMSYPHYQARAIWSGGQSNMNELLRLMEQEIHDYGLTSHRGKFRIFCSFLRKNWIWIGGIPACVMTLITLYFKYIR